MKRLHQLGLHVQSLRHSLTQMDLRKAMIVLVRANAIDAAMAGCSWCKHMEEEHTALEFLCDRGDQMCRKAAAEYCTNSLAATECGTSWSSIQWTTLLLFFVGVICSFKAERRVMFLPCKGVSVPTILSMSVPKNFGTLLSKQDHLVLHLISTGQLETSYTARSKEETLRFPHFCPGNVRCFDVQTTSPEDLLIEQWRCDKLILHISRIDR